MHIDSVVRLCQSSGHDTTLAVTKLKHAVHTLYSSFYVARSVYKMGIILCTESRKKLTILQIL